MNTLSLGDDLSLALDGGRLEVRDGAKSYLEDQGYSFARAEGELAGGRPRFVFPVAVFDSGASRAEPAAPPAGHRLEAEASFADGGGESWSIAVDDRRSTWTWTRRSARPRAMHFTIDLPRQERTLELWQTGSADQIHNEAVPNAHDAKASELSADAETELLFFSPFARTCFRLALSAAGRLRVAKEEVRRPGEPGEPEWKIGPEGKVLEERWSVTWEVPPAAEVSLSASWGAAAVARDFAGRMKLSPVDASADIGPFFAQMYLGCLPLNLRLQEEGALLAPSANVVIAREALHYRRSWSRDNVFGYEFLSLVDPPSVAELVRAYLDWRLAAPGFTGSADDAEVEILLLAGRHFILTGDRAYAARNLDRYHALAEWILSLRPAGSALPLNYGSWDGQGGPCKGIEPYFVAECHVALRRLAEIDRALGRGEADGEAARWEDAAAAMRRAALADRRSGGLWHAERGTFINYVDHRALGEYGPREQIWITPPRRDRRDEGVVREEYAHYETIVPAWLGLLDDPQAIRGAFRWIDAHWSYATGLGGATFPPRVCQNFIALLDVYVRLRHGVPGADRLLQLVLDRVFDAGVPLAEHAFGSYAGAGPLRMPSGDYFLQTNTGRIWDNAPYFGIVIGLHYGLDYSWRGWRIGDPRPLANYPLTRLEGLRHRDAVLSLRWKGTGKVREVRVDGERLEGRTVGVERGEHEVEILLERGS